MSPTKIEPCCEHGLSDQVNPSIPARMWGPTLARYYEATRVELPHEKEFWRSLLRDTPNVCEIGAGSGFLSESFLDIGIQSLTLVEPEIQNILLLVAKLAARERPLTSESPVVTIVCNIFQGVDLVPQDIIAFPFDSLPMLPSRDARKLLFANVARTLKPGGLFAVHFSSVNWNLALLDQKGPPHQREVPTMGHPIHVTKHIISETDSSYIKHIKLEVTADKAIEEYAIRTFILDIDEVVEDVEATGLHLDVQYSDFEGRNIQGDEVIQLFRK